MFNQAAAALFFFQINIETEIKNCQFWQYFQPDSNRTTQYLNIFAMVKYITNTKFEIKYLKKN